MQETAAAFVDQVQLNSELMERYVLLSPANLDGRRDQNSVILLNRELFVATDYVDVTRQVRIEIIRDLYIVRRIMVLT